MTDVLPWFVIGSCVMNIFFVVIILFNLPAALYNPSTPTGVITAEIVLLFTFGSSATILYMCLLAL